MLKCHIVRQLVPNYVDGLLDEESKKDIEEHIATCSDCDALVKSMRIRIVDSSTKQDASTKEIAYLKKIRRKNIAAVLLVALLLLAAFCGAVKLFFIGSPVNSNDMKINAHTAIYHEDDGMLFLLDFELTNGKTLNVDAKYIESPDGNYTGVVLTPKAVANNPLDDTGPDFQYGYHLSSGEDFRITIRYKDDKVIYDMREWVQ